MTLAYQRGYRAAKTGKPRSACPFEGHSNASLSLQLQWQDGWFDATTGKRLVHRRAKHLTRRKTCGRRWPRSEYARRRVQALLEMRS